MKWTAVLLLAGSALGAQVRPEVRLDASNTGGSVRGEAGLGVAGMFGPYLRAGLTVSRDVLHDATVRPLSRAEVDVRFLLDPLAEERWGLSFAAGLGWRDGRAYFAVAADLEGPPVARVRPAIQVALGAGVRLGLVVRAVRANRR